MNIGWLLLIFALVCLILMAFLSRWRKGQDMQNRLSNSTTYPDTQDVKINAPSAMPVNLDEVEHLVRAGRTLDAVKLYREITGATLAQSKTAVERLATRARVAANPQSISSLDGDNGISQRELVSLLMQGQKIQAIKRYRESTGLGLREAKDAIDLMEENLLLHGPDFYQTRDVIPEPPGRAISEEVFSEEAFNEEIRGLLLKNQKIQAIKRYREQTGLGLREAKDAVEQLEKNVPVSSFPGPVTPLEEFSAADPGEEVRTLLLEGKKIQAIKLYREQTGLGLREAKAAVDLLEHSLHYGLEQT